MRTHFQRRRGFTMVEIMVVIGIVALLLAILMPTLSRVRQSADRTQCTSNLRQIMMACSMYENNWNSSCPWPNWRGPEVAGYRPPGWLYQYPKGTTATATQNDVQAGSLYEYIGSTSVYHCPRDTGPTSTSPVQILTSYLMNGAVLAYGKQLQPYRVTDFQADSIMFWEASPTGPAWTSGSVHPSQGITTRHDNGGAVACFDGHVEWMSAANFNKEASNLPGRLWCNPARKGGN